MNNLKETTYNGLSVVQNERHQWGVVDQKSNIIVPFGKYDWIDGFDQGLARVNKRIMTGKVSFLKTKKYWGVINEKGEEVLPLEYEEIWNFLGKNRYSTKVVKDGVQRTIYFHDLNPELPQRNESRSYSSNDIGYYEDPNKDLYFDINQCYDREGHFDYERLADAIMDGEYIPEDW